MRLMRLLGCMLMVAVASAAEPTISITATPRYPWNGMVDVRFTIGADEAEGGYAEAQPGDETIAGRRLKYVQSVGDAQLNTGIVPGSKNTIELKFAWEDNPAKVNECLFCARGSTTSTATYTGFLINGTWRFDYNSTTGTTNAVPKPTLGVPMVVRDKAGTTTVNGTVAQSYTAANFAVGGPLTLFASYVGAPGTTTDNHMAGKIYYLKIFGDDGTTLLHDFVPWEKDGVVGMYDRIAARFVAPNVGTLTSGTKYDTSFTAKDVAGGTNLTMRTLYKSNGAVANVGKEALLPGTYSWVWDATADLGEGTVLERVVVEGNTKAQVYYVKFNANGGTGTMANEEFQVGVAKALTANAFTRTGYTFQGWATSSTGAKVFSDKQSVTDLTTTVDSTMNLYAVWKSALYMVIDLSGGSSAKSYAVSYMGGTPSGGWGTNYKTKKLVLRRCEAGTYKMQNVKNVTLTKAFYIGIYPVTQLQYKQIMGSIPGQNKWTSGDQCPCFFVSYNMIRGSSKWPSSNEVGSGTVLSRLRARTNLQFDLPTEAQWEYACRAGTTTGYYWGSNFNQNNLWWSDNCDRAQVVGQKLPNKWGLYDMCGNAWEHCLDWYGDLSYGTDPKGAKSNSLSRRVRRGGDWQTSDSDVFNNNSSYSRDYDSESWAGDDDSFRLCITLE